MKSNNKILCSQEALYDVSKKSKQPIRCKPLTSSKRFLLLLGLQIIYRRYLSIYDIIFHIIFTQSYFSSTETSPNISKCRSLNLFPRQGTNLAKKGTLRACTIVTLRLIMFCPYTYFPSSGQFLETTELQTFKKGKLSCIWRDNLKFTHCQTDSEIYKLTFTWRILMVGRVQIFRIVGIHFA